MNGREWTTTEVRRLRDLAPFKSAREIGVELNRTRRAVLRMATRQKIRIPRDGERHHRAHLTDAQIRAVRALHARDVPQVVIARGLKISDTHVSKIVRGRARIAP